MAFADFVQSEEKIISESVKENLDRLQKDSDTKLKTIFKSLVGFASATTNGIISGMANAKNELQTVNEKTNLSNKITNIKPVKTIPQLTQTNGTESSAEEQELHTTHLTEIVKNTALLDTMDKLLLFLHHINTSISTVANELVGDSIFKEEREREKRIREEEMLAVQQRIADGIEDIDLEPEITIDTKKDGWFMNKLGWLKWLGIGGFFGIGFLGEALKDIGKFYIKITKQLGNFVKSVWNGLIKTGGKIIKGIESIFRPITNLFSKMIEPIRPIIDNVLSKGSSFFKYIDDFFKRLINSPIVKIIKSVATKLKGIGIGIFSKISDLFSFLGKIATKIPGVGTLVKALSSGSKLAKSIPGLGQIIMVVDSVIQGLMGAFKGWGEGESLIDKIKGALSGAVSGIFKAIVGDLVNLGADLVGLLFKGIGKLFGSEKISNWGDKIKNFDIMPLYNSILDLAMRPINWMIDFFGDFRGNMSKLNEWWGNMMKSFRNKMYKFILALTPNIFGMKDWLAKKMGLRPEPNEFKPDTTVIGASPVTVPYVPETVEQRMVRFGKGEEYKEWKGKIDRGRNLNDQSNENADTKRQLNVITTNQLNNVQPVSISNGQTNMMIPEPATDINDPITTGMRRAYSF